MDSLTVVQSMYKWKEGSNTFFLRIISFRPEEREGDVVTRELR